VPTQCNKLLSLKYLRDKFVLQKPLQIVSLAKTLPKLGFYIIHQDFKLSISSSLYLDPSPASLIEPLRIRNTQSRLDQLTNNEKEDLLKFLDQGVSIQLQDLLQFPLFELAFQKKYIRIPSLTRPISISQQFSKACPELRNLKDYFVEKFFRIYDKCIPRLTDAQCLISYLQQWRVLDAKEKDMILTYIHDNYSILDDPQFKAQLKETPFVKLKGKGEFEIPAELYDPELTRSESVPLPDVCFQTAEWLKILRDLGLRKNLPKDLLIKWCRNIKNKDDEKDFLSHLQVYIKDVKGFLREIKDIPFLFPKFQPHFWKNERSMKNTRFPLSRCAPPSEWYLVSTTHCMLDEIYFMKLSQYLPDLTISLQDVLQNLKAISQRKEEIEPSAINPSTHKIYYFLEKHLFSKKTFIIQEMNQFESILVNSKFYKPENILIKEVFDSSLLQKVEELEDLEIGYLDRFYFSPDRFIKLFDALGITERNPSNIPKLIKISQKFIEKHSSNSSKKLTDNLIKSYHRILKVIMMNMDGKVVTLEDLLLPNQNNEMKDPKELIFNDLLLQLEANELQFANDILEKEICEFFQVPLLSNLVKFEDEVENVVNEDDDVDGILSLYQSLLRSRIFSSFITSQSSDAHQSDEDFSIKKESLKSITLLPDSKFNRTCFWKQTHQKIDSRPQKRIYLSNKNILFVQNIEEIHFIVKQFVTEYFSFNSVDSIYFERRSWSKLYEMEASKKLMIGTILDEFDIQFFGLKRRGMEELKTGDIVAYCPLFLQSELQVQQINIQFIFGKISFIPTSGEGEEEDRQYYQLDIGQEQFVKTTSIESIFPLIRDGKVIVQQSEEPEKELYLRIKALLEHMKNSSLFEKVFEFFYFAESVVHDLNCPVCLEPMKEPTTFSCRHSTCLGCAKKFQKDLCPMCRKPFSKDHLVVNHVLRGLVKILYPEQFQNENENELSQGNEAGSQNVNRSHLEDLIELVQPNPVLFQHLVQQVNSSQNQTTNTQPNRHQNLNQNRTRRIYRDPFSSPRRTTTCSHCPTHCPH